MNYKCPFCFRTFSKRSAYAQHMASCLKKPIESSSESDSESDKISYNESESEGFHKEQDTSFNSNQSFESTQSNITSEISIMSYNDIINVEESDMMEEYDNVQGSDNAEESDMMEKYDNIQESDNAEESDNILVESDNILEKFDNLMVESDNNIKEFPNEAYADLMTLVTNHKLNNKASNAIIQFFNKHSNLPKSPLPKNIEKGRKFMNDMKFPNLTFKKIGIVNHHQEEYFLHYQDLINCIKNILAIPDITQDFAWSFENCEYEGERVYKEQNTGTWWKDTENSLPLGAKLLSLILYSDATTTDTLGKSQLHPIYVSIGNIPAWRRNKSDAKQLLGYLPILKAANNTERTSLAFKYLVRNTFHKSLCHLLEPITSLKSGIDLLVNNETIWFYPRVSVIIADWPEAATYCLTYKSSNSNLPCHFCLVTRDNLAEINLQTNDVILRTHENMRYNYNKKSEKSVCIEPIYNFFWDLPNINIYSATVPDRMHHLDLGLFHYQLEYTRLLLSNILVDELDNRLAAIPRHSGLKIFSNGLQSIARLTADEYRNLMKIMIFVVDNLYNGNDKEEKIFINNDLPKLYESWNKMYILSRYEKFNESDLEKFKNAIYEWAQRFIKAFKSISPSGLKLPKLHSWMHHIIDSIRLYGVINGYTTETYESLHKNFVKAPYRISNRKNIEHQLLETIRRQAIIHIISRPSINLAKTPCAYKFSTKLFEFSLQDADTFIYNIKENSTIDNKMQTGFDKFLDCLDLYLDLIENLIISESRVRIYGSITLENGTIVRATSNYHNRPWFSNIAISMNVEESNDYLSDEGVCYGQTLLLTEILIGKEYPLLNLALVQWYNLSQTHPYIYGCPHLRLIKLYNFVAIEAIQDVVHIVPRFGKTNEYFVNKYIF